MAFAFFVLALLRAVVENISVDFALDVVNLLVALTRKSSSSIRAVKATNENNN